eukprot:449934_1
MRKSCIVLLSLIIQVMIINTNAAAAGPWSPRGRGPRDARGRRGAAAPQSEWYSEMEDMHLLAKRERDGRRAAAALPPPIPRGKHSRDGRRPRVESDTESERDGRRQRAAKRERDEQRAAVARHLSQRDARAAALPPLIPRGRHSRDGRRTRGIEDWLAKTEFERDGRRTTAARLLPPPPIPRERESRGEPRPRAAAAVALIDDVTAKVRGLHRVLEELNDQLIELMQLV